MILIDVMDSVASPGFPRDVLEILSWRFWCMTLFTSTTTVSVDGIGLFFFELYGGLVLAAQRFWNCDSNSNPNDVLESHLLRTRCRRLAAFSWTSDGTLMVLGWNARPITWSRNWKLWCPVSQSPWENGIDGMLDRRLGWEWDSTDSLTQIDRICSWDALIRCHFK